MGKIEKLKHLVEEKGDGFFCSMVIQAKECNETLRKAFYREKIDKTKLWKVLSDFFNSLFENEEFKGMINKESEAYVLGIIFIVRHTWGLIDLDGDKKTGDDLHNTIPLMFEGGKTLSAEDIFSEIIKII